MKFKQVQMPIPPQFFFQKQELQQQQNSNNSFLLEDIKNSNDSLNMLKDLKKIDLYEEEQNMQEVIKFYKHQMNIQQTNQQVSLTLPILCLKHRQKHNFKVVTIVLQKQGMLFSQILDSQISKIQNFLLIELKRVIQALNSSNFFPVIQLQNIYLKQYNEKFQINILPSDKVLDEKHFVQKLKVILVKIIKSDKNIKQKLISIQSVNQIIKLCNKIIEKYEENEKEKNKKQASIDQKYSIKNLSHEWNLFSQTNQKSPLPSKIQITQQNWSKMFKKLNFQIKSKEFILSGKSIKFNPVALHKKIQDKGPLLYVIQDQLQNKIAFLTYVKLPKKFQPIFGTYFKDQNENSAIYDFKSSHVFKPKDINYSVGYGPQIFLAIGKLDIVISAFNINNFCYFPYTYAPHIQKKQHKQSHKKGQSQFQINQKIQQQAQEINQEEQEKINLFQTEFIVKNLDIYHLVEKQKQKKSQKQVIHNKQANQAVKPNKTLVKKQQSKPLQKQKTNGKALEKKEEPKPNQKLLKTPNKNQLKQQKSKQKSLSKTNLEKHSKK